MEPIKWIVSALLVVLSVVAGNAAAYAVKRAPSPEENAAGGHVGFREMPLLTQLPSRCVLAIFEDRDGEMWLGTEDGLSRNNGYNIVTYRTHPPRSNSSNGSKIYAIAQSATGEIWFSTDMGLFRLNKLSGEILPVVLDRLKGGRITALHCGPDGNMWVAGTDVTLRVSPLGRVLTAYRFKGKKGSRAPFPQSFLTDTKKRLWATLEGSGVALWDSSRNAWKRFPWPFAESSGQMVEDRSGAFFYIIRAMNGMVRFSPDAGSGNEIYTPLAVDSRGDERDAQMLYMVQDSKTGNLWVTTGNGLRVYAPRGSSLVPLDHLFPQQQRFQMLTHIIKDSNDNIWVAGYNVPTFAILPRDHIRTDSVSAIRKQSSHASTISKICYDDDPQMLWIFQERHRLYLYNRQTRRAECQIPGEFTSTHNNAGAVRAIVKSQRQRGVWIASDTEKAIFRLIHSGNNISVAHRIPFPGHTVNSLLENTDGNIWIGAQDGLWVYLPATRQTIQLTSGETVTDIKEGLEGTVYVSSLKSAEKSAISAWKAQRLTSATTLTGNCTALGVTSRDLWVGMSSGEVYRFPNKNLHTSPRVISQTSDYQPYGNVGGMITDHAGNLWIQSNQRICALNPSTMAVNEFFANDPELNLFNFFPQSLTHTPEGGIIAGGTGGFALFSPSPQKAGTFRPKPVIFTALNINGEQRAIPSSGEVLHLSRGEHTLEVEVSSPNPLYAHTQGYAYRLLPTDTVWHKLQPGENIVTLNHIPAGSHTLEVKMLGRGTPTPDMIGRLSLHRPRGVWAYLVALGVLLLGATALIFRRRRKTAAIPQEPPSSAPLPSPTPSFSSPALSAASSPLTAPPMSDLSDPSDSSDGTTSPSLPAEAEESPLPPLPEEEELELSHDSAVDTADSEIMLEVDRLLELNFSNADYGIAELSADMHISRMTLYRKIQHITNQSPTDYLKSFRMHRALRLLDEGHLTINEIAYATGFNSPSYFSRAFKAEFGKTPSQYRHS